MSTENVKKVQEARQKRYHFFNDDYELYAEDATDQEFIEEVRDNAYSEDSVFFRVPVELFEQVQVKSQVVKVQ